MLTNDLVFLMSDGLTLLALLILHRQNFLSKPSQKEDTEPGSSNNTNNTSILLMGEQRSTKAWSSGKCWSHIQNWCSNLGIWLHYCWKWNESDLRVDICGCGQIQFLWFKHVTGLCFNGFNSESCERFLLDQIAWFGFSDNFGSWFSVTFNFIL